MQLKDVDSGLYAHYIKYKYLARFLIKLVYHVYRVSTFEDCEHVHETGLNQKWTHFSIFNSSSGTSCCLLSFLLNKLDE